MNTLRHQQVKRRKGEHGFSITELLVASTIGLFVIIGAYGAFSASREAARIAQYTNNTQESLRYLAQTITRVVRAGSALTVTDTGDVTQLEVTFPNDDDEMMDCLGAPIDKNKPNIFTLNNQNKPNELTCQVGNDGDALELVDGLDDSGFTVELLKPDDDSDSDTYGGLIAASSEDATSVYITIRMQPLTEGGTAPEVSFVATMRCKILGCL